jgi:hypothetical protein
MKPVVTRHIPGYGTVTGNSDEVEQIVARHDVDNLRWMVACHGDKFAILRLNVEMDKDEALNLAAWLVALADPGGAEFAEYLKAVQST